MINCDILGLKLSQAIEILDQEKVKYEIIEYVIDDYRFDLSQDKRVVAVIDKAKSSEIYVAYEQKAVI